MDEKITAIGAVVLLVGIALFFGYLPLVGESADKLSMEYHNGNFDKYASGDRVTVYGKVTDIEYLGDIGEGGVTKLILNTRDNIPVYVDGNISGTLEKGERIYVKCYVYRPLTNISDNISYSEILRSSSGSIHETIWVNVTFIIVASAGAVVLVIGIRRL